jgi:hypothetical protein
VVLGLSSSNLSTLIFQLMGGVTDSVRQVTVAESKHDLPFAGVRFVITGCHRFAAMEKNVVWGYNSYTEFSRKGQGSKSDGYE